MENLRFPMPDQAPDQNVSSGYCHTALTLGRPTSPVDHRATFCQRNDGDMANQTTGPSPSVRDIELPDNDMTMNS